MEIYRDIPGYKGMALRGSGVELSEKCEGEQTMTVIEMHGYDHRAVYIPASHTVMYIEEFEWATDTRFAINVSGHGQMYELARYDTEEAANEAMRRLIHAMENEVYIDLSVKDPEGL